MKIFDTHCHLILLKNGRKTIDEVAVRAIKKGVFCLLDISVGLSGFVKRRELITRITGDYPLSIEATVGIPPYFSDKRSYQDIDEVKRQAESWEKVIGIGEIGLDYYHNYGSKSGQIGLFIEQIELANQLQLPVIIHTRCADDDLITTLNSHRPERTGIIHCFSSDAGMARKLLDLGFYISFAGNSTYKKSGSIRNAMAVIPGDRYVIETDSPYLSPEGFRGKQNEPAYITATAQCIALVRNISLEEVANQTMENAKRVLGLIKEGSVQ